MVVFRFTVFFPDSFLSFAIRRPGSSVRSKKMKTKLSVTLLALLVGVASVSAGEPPVNNPVPEAGATIVLLGLGVRLFSGV